MRYLLPLLLAVLLAACASPSHSGETSRHWFARCTTAHGYRHFVTADSTRLADTLGFWRGRGLLTAASRCAVEPEWP